MSISSPLLTDEQRKVLGDRYRGKFQVPRLGYGTVADYCDSCDSLPTLANLQGDLKDLQRPWTVKAILGLCPIGSRILEIGAGEPIVAQTLTELGYSVVVVDPYDGSGNGPTEFWYYRQKYPDIEIHKAMFSAKLDAVKGSFDAIYSISVLEHVHEPYLSQLFEGISRFLNRGGHSLHSIDYVTVGHGAEFHRDHLSRVLAMQAAIGGLSPSSLLAETLNTLTDLNNDLETYFLSAAGHNLWRGTTAYSTFPFRRVASVLSRAQAQ